MKAELTKGGYILITAETIEEAYALTNPDVAQKMKSVIIDCSILNEKRQPLE